MLGLVLRFNDSWRKSPAKSLRNIYEQPRKADVEQQKDVSSFLSGFIQIIKMGKHQKHPRTKQTCCWWAPQLFVEETLVVNCFITPLKLFFCPNKPWDKNADWNVWDRSGLEIHGKVEHVEPSIPKKEDAQPKSMFWNGERHMKYTLKYHVLVVWTLSCQRFLSSRVRNR